MDEDSSGQSGNVSKSPAINDSVEESRLCTTDSGGDGSTSLHVCHTKLCEDSSVVDRSPRATHSEAEATNSDQLVSNVPSGAVQKMAASEESLVKPEETDHRVQDQDVSGPGPCSTKRKPVGNLRLLTGSWKEFGQDNYLRGCKWSPDGTCLLSCSNDNIMRLYNLPPQLYSDPGAAHNLSEMSPALSVAQGETVYDFCWYPKMNSWEPNTCCFVTSCKDHPVQLWDAFIAERRTAYVPYNDVDEVISPHSLAFSLDGERLYTGFNKCIKVFNISRPGRECTTVRTYERKKGGQPGIISCIAMHPTMPGTYALGSYSCSVGLYSDDYNGALMLLTGISNGVTHLMISDDGKLLHTGFRKHDLIQSWDLRNPGKILYELKREVSTNQRIYFDLYDVGNYIISGSSDGCLYGWCLDNEEVECEQATLLSPCCQCKVHGDVVNGVSVHPTLPVLATCSGQRRFPLSSYSCEEDSSDSDLEEQRDYENSLKLWLLLDS